MPIGECAEFLREIELSTRDKQIAELVMKEVNERLRFLLDVGLDYLSLSAAGGDPRRRRGAADPARDADRLRPRRRALRPRRAVDRPAPARQPPADRDARPAARPRQHPDRRRARRGHDQGRRLGRRHRPGCGRARRPGRRVRQRRGPDGEHRLAHRRVRERPPQDRGPGDPSSGRPQAVASSSRARASTTCRT